MNDHKRIFYHIHVLITANRAICNFVCMIKYVHNRARVSGFFDLALGMNCLFLTLLMVKIFSGVNRRKQCGPPPNSMVGCLQSQRQSSCKISGNLPLNQCLSSEPKTVCLPNQWRSTSYSNGNLPTHSTTFITILRACLSACPTTSPTQFHL